MISVLFTKLSKHHTVELQKYLGITRPLAIILQGFLSPTQKHLAATDEGQRCALHMGETEHSKSPAGHEAALCDLKVSFVQVKMKIGKCMTKIKMEG